MASVERSRRVTGADADHLPWLGLFALGLGLLVLGIAAVLLPDYSNPVTSTVLGVVLGLAGLITIIHAFRAKNWSGFTWELLAGAAEAVGGILIVINPMKGAAAVTLLVAIVLAAQGAAQFGLALRIRPQAGWPWLAGASLLSLVIAGMLVLRFPFAAVEQPGAMAGIALGFAGIAYLLLAFGRRRAAAERAP
jgi:uncharacterized membrane protein HdeD (DUF308 family)